MLIYFVSAALYNVVPSHIVTARKLINNFIFSDPVNAGSLTQNTEVLTKDIVVVLDGSGSIGSCEFNKGTTALRNMIELERESRNDTKYAAVTFSNSAVVNFSFLPYTEVATEIFKILYQSGGTNTQAKLAKAKTLFDISSSGITFFRTVSIDAMKVKEKSTMNKIVSNASSHEWGQTR